jgi:hypothetical protein
MRAILVKEKSFIIVARRGEIIQHTSSNRRLPLGADFSKEFVSWYATIAGKGVHHARVRGDRESPIELPSQNYARRSIQYPKILPAKIHGYNDDDLEIDENYQSSSFSSSGNEPYHQDDSTFLADSVQEYLSNRLAGGRR